MAEAQEAWTAWFREHGAAMLLFARQWVADYSDAEDVVQEAFIRFWRVAGVESSKPRISDPKAYLFACVKSCALEWLRSRRRRTHREEAAAKSEAESALFTASLEQEERRTAIEAGLRCLPEPQREVLVLKIWAGLSFPQIAAALEISANTAASRYRYALDKLREQLSSEPGVSTPRCQRPDEEAIS